MRISPSLGVSIKWLHPTFPLCRCYKRNSQERWCADAFAESALHDSLYFLSRALTVGSLLVWTLIAKHVNLYWYYHIRSSHSIELQVTHDKCANTFAVYFWCIDALFLFMCARSQAVQKQCLWSLLTSVNIVGLFVWQHVESAFHAHLHIEMSSGEWLLNS